MHQGQVAREGSDTTHRHLQPLVGFPTFARFATRAFSRSPFSPFRKLDAGRCDRALLIPRRGQRDLDGSLGGCTVMGFAESVVPRLQAISLAVY